MGLKDYYCHYCHCADWLLDPGLVKLTNRGGIRKENGGEMHVSWSGFWIRICNLIPHDAWSRFWSFIDHHSSLITPWSLMRWCRIGDGGREWFQWWNIIGTMSVCIIGAGEWDYFHGDNFCMLFINLLCYWLMILFEKFLSCCPSPLSSLFLVEISED